MNNLHSFIKIVFTVALLVAWVSWGVAVTEPFSRHSGSVAEALNLWAFIIATLLLVLVPFVPLGFGLRKQAALEREN